MAWTRPKWRSRAAAPWPTEKETFAKRLLGLRERRAMSQEATAQFVGASLRQYSRWENGKNMPNTESMAEIAAAYGLTPEQLLNGSAVSDEALVRLARVETKLDALAAKLGVDLPAQ